MNFRNVLKSESYTYAGNDDERIFLLKIGSINDLIYTIIIVNILCERNHWIALTINSAVTRMLSKSKNQYIFWSKEFNG